MALRDYKPKTDTISIGDGDPIKIRGINVRDLSILFDSHRDDLTMLYSLWNSAEMAPTGEARVNRVLVEAIHAAPGMTAAVIAVACDEPDAAGVAASLPFPTQLDALVKITRLTFEESGGMGNFFASLGSMIAGLGLGSRPAPVAAPTRKAKPETISTP
jgi:hypothetical protein